MTEEAEQYLGRKLPDERLSRVLRDLLPQGTVQAVVVPVQELLDFKLKTFSTSDDWAGESIAVAFEKGITIYDSVYLGLAHWLRGSLRTADSAFLKKVDDPLVIPLGKDVL